MAGGRYTDLAFGKGGGAMSLTTIEIETLGRYNAEKDRGIVHTKEWTEKMAELQKVFDACDWHPFDPTARNPHS